MAYKLRPEEHELRKARETVEKVFESCKYSLEKNKVLEVSLGASPSETSDEHGARGFAVNSEASQMYFIPEVENWEDDLEVVARKVYGKSYFYEKTDASGLLWREFLAESFALMFLEQTSEGREVENVQEFEGEWDDKKDFLGQMLSVEIEENFSWQIKWLVGKKLLENHELEEFTELKKSDIEGAGEEVFK
mgnify:CR=1 FL=1